MWVITNLSSGNERLGLESGNPSLFFAESIGAPSVHFSRR